MSLFSARVFPALLKIEVKKQHGFHNQQKCGESQFCVLLFPDAASTITKTSQCLLDICTQIKNHLFHERPANTEDTVQWKKVHYSRRLLRNFLFQLQASICHCQCREGVCFKLDAVKIQQIYHVRLFYKRSNSLLFKQNTN